MKLDALLHEQSFKIFKMSISVKLVKLFGCIKKFNLLQLPILYSVRLITNDHNLSCFHSFFQMEHIKAVKYSLRVIRKVS